MNLLALSSLLFAASIFVFMLGLSLGDIESPLLIDVLLWGATVSFYVIGIWKWKRR